MADSSEIHCDLEACLSQAPLPCLVCSAEGRIRYANNPMRALLQSSKDFADSLLALVPRLQAEGERLEHRGRIATNEGELEFSFQVYACREPGRRTLSVVFLGVDITTRADQERRMREQEHRFRRLVEDLGSEHVLYALLPDGTISYAGTGTKHFVGLDPEQCVGRSVFDVIRFESESGSLALRNLRGLLGGQPYSISDLQYRHPDGSLRSMHVASHPILSPEGGVLGVEGLCWDITERKRMLEALAQREATVRAMINATSDIVVLYDGEGTILEANDAYARRIGWARSALPGRNLRDVLPPERLRQRLADTRVAREGKAPVRGIYVWGDVWEQYVLYPLPGPDGEPEAFVFFAHDVTELKSSELELRKLRTAIEQANVAMIVVDGKGVVEFVNNQYLRLTGQRREDILGHFAASLRPWRLDLPSRRALRRALRSGGSWRGEAHYQRRDGKDFWIDCSLSPVVRSLDGDVLYVIAAKEVTERKRLEIAREDAERVVRHNLKSPLNTLSNVMYLLRQCGALQGEQLEYLALGEEAVARMLRQVEMSLALYRMETGAYRFQGRRVDLAGLLRGALAGLRIEAAKRNIALRLRIDGEEDAGGEVEILADEAYLGCMLDNLLENALEASEPGQAVEVEIVRVDEGGVELRIANAGTVPEAMRHRFFEKYATYGKPHGTGLGTYSARLIAEAMGGGIRMHSAEGRGTRVEVRFPPADGVSAGSDRTS